VALRVHVLYEHSEDLRPHGCSYIRLLQPLTHFSNQDIFDVSQGATFTKADVVIVERTWRPDISLSMAEDLVDRVRGDGICLIYSIDDDLLNFQPRLFRNGLSEEKMRVVRYFAREANGIIVSTECLRERLLGFNSRIVAVPNTLDERLWKSKLDWKLRKARTAGKIIGFMGTYTHDEDLMVVLQPLREVLRKHGDNIEAEFVGGFADPALMRAFEGLPVRVVNVEGNTEYPAFVRWMMQNLRWDLAIAPLEDNPFTHCKSDIKFLDYSALGIAGIYSRVPAYETTVRHLETGYLSSNLPNAWREAFEILFADDFLREKLARQAQEYVYSGRLLENCAQSWREAIYSILNSAQTAV
jgi:glycosyltransferase involved in cell wall biosynthesis